MASVKGLDKGGGLRFFFKFLKWVMGVKKYNDIVERKEFSLKIGESQIIWGGI